MITAVNLMELGLLGIGIIYMTGGGITGIGSNLPKDITFLNANNKKVLLMSIFEYILLIPLVAVTLVIYWYFWKIYKKCKHNHQQNDTKRVTKQQIDTPTSTKSAQLNNDYFLPFWVIIFALLSSFVRAAGITPFDGNTKILLLYSGIVLSVSSIPVLIAWYKNKKHRVAITILSYLISGFITIFIIVLAWSIFDKIDHNKPNQQTNIKEIIPISGILICIFLYSANGIYVSTNKYLEKFVSDCIHTKTNFYIMDKLSFCECTKEQVVAPLVKKIGIIKFETNFRKEPYTTLMLDAISYNCAQYTH